MLSSKSLFRTALVVLLLLATGARAEMTVEIVGGGADRHALSCPNLVILSQRFD